ncbi:MAG: AMP-binding protein [Solirubrobacterales bacterium]
MRSHRMRSVRVLRRSLGAGVVLRMRPDKSLRARSLISRWGLTPAAAYGLAAIRYPDRAAIIDERGPLTFAEVHRRTDALAHALGATAIEHRDTVAIMCRNHRGLIEATVACSKLGANVLYLDPGAAASTLADVVAREDPHALIYDEEFSELLRPLGHRRRRFIAWCDPGRHSRYPLLEELIARQGSVLLAPPGRGKESSVTLACLGPGSPQGAGRKLPSSLLTPGAIVSRIPLRRGEVTIIGAPMFSSWGFLHFTLGLRLSSTLVLHREFDPHQVLAAADEHQATALAVLPEMLEAIMALPEATSACYDTDALRVIAVQGRALPSEVALPAIRRFGDVLYNLHGPIVVQLDGDWVRQTHAVGEPTRVVGDLWLSGGPVGEYAARRGA